MTCIELRGEPLIFVLKLDEAELMHGKKFEPVSLTLMNRALNLDIQRTNEKYFSMQSKQEIWSIVAFQVEKELYKVLSWVFGRTKFPGLISAQSNGQILHIDEVGDFNVQWHMAANMKTIKAMYNLKNGSGCRMHCI